MGPVSPCYWGLIDFVYCYALVRLSSKVMGEANFLPVVFGFPVAFDVIVSQQFTHCCQGQSDLINMLSVDNICQ